MTLLLFFTLLTFISLLPMLLYKQHQGETISPKLFIFATILFLLTPVVALYMVVHFITHIIITIFLGIFS